MKKEILIASLALGCAFAAVAEEPAPAARGPEGYWHLEEVTCRDGRPGTLRYESVQLRLEDEAVNAELSREGCDISISGIYSIADSILTMEFNAGTWSSCSGSLPNYVLGRFGLRHEDKNLVLTSNDLAPFGYCDGEGELHFNAE